MSHSFEMVPYGLGEHMRLFQNGGRSNTSGGVSVWRGLEGVRGFVFDLNCIQVNAYGIGVNQPTT